MKVTVKINNDVDIVITLTPEQLASIEAQNKPKKFKWEYPYYKTFRIDPISVHENSIGGSIADIEHGRYRKTKEAAEQSLARNKRANRLEALAEQLGGLVLNPQITSYHICFLTLDEKWGYAQPLNFIPEVVYMTKECATEICRMLNEGEFSLDGEL